MRASERKQLLLHRKLLFPSLMLIQIPPRIHQPIRQHIRRILIPQYQANQMPLQPLRFIIHERVPRMHHAQIIEKDHIAGLELNHSRMFDGDVMQSVEGTSLDRRQGWQ